MAGDDVFGSHRPDRHRSPFFNRMADDGDDFWDHLEERHAQHRQHLHWLLAGIGVICVLGVTVHTGFFGFAVMLLIPLTVELVMYRRTRPHSKIPDYRPPDRVEIDLDDA